MGAVRVVANQSQGLDRFLELGRFEGRKIAFHLASLGAIDVGLHVRKPLRAGQHQRHLRGHIRRYRVQRALDGLGEQVKSETRRLAVCALPNLPVKQRKIDAAVPHRDVNGLVRAACRQGHRACRPDVLLLNFVLI